MTNNQFNFCFSGDVEKIEFKTLESGGSSCLLELSDVEFFVVHKCDNGNIDVTKRLLSFEIDDCVRIKLKSVNGSISLKEKCVFLVSDVDKSESKEHKDHDDKNNQNCLCNKVFFYILLSKLKQHVKNPSDFCTCNLNFKDYDLDSFVLVCEIVDKNSNKT